ncbi:dead end protein homolog 1 isoform X2 [Rana temporaria]|uniref:dead end protein homolog 1 isoform X2 n=1 Tax=Rana temporaria TaxID=8407 RepID=UPI001AAC9DF3|nr:dead end protein homolog 1 isoform X2 [Rana temporaria]
MKSSRAQTYMERADRSMMDNNMMNTDSEAWIHSLNKDNKASLLEWIEKCNINLVQVNGQRKCGGPPAGWVGEAPPLGTEIFINNLPQEIYEDKIIPLFQTAGTLYEFRLMMTFSGLNRGFGFARYTTVHHAELAVSMFNGYEILPGYKIGVCKSIEKCHLELDGLPCAVDKVFLTSVLNEVTVDLEKVSLFASPNMEMKNLTILKYSSHRAATMAKRILCSHLLFGCQIQVNWMKNSIKKKLYLRTLLKPHSSAPQMNLNVEPAPSGVECLRLICDQLGQGQPVYQIKFLSLGSCGWLRFWYQVVIPNYCEPFTGYAWLIGDKLIPTDKYEQAKEIVALRILAKLGYIDD